jgi:hypothetical protein
MAEHQFHYGRCMLCYRFASECFRWEQDQFWCDGIAFDECKTVSASPSTSPSTIPSEEHP